MIVLIERKGRSGSQRRLSKLVGMKHVDSESEILVEREHLRLTTKNDEIHLNG